jgi:AraC family transcriptional regulator of adaptative response / DNA-3-methyladenine glycosylase II
VAAGSLDLDAAASVAAPERDAAIERLGALPGIGPWTAQYVAMRALRDPDALPASDLGLRRALARPGGAPLAAREVEARAAAWRPWRAYGVIALWREPPDGALNRRSRSARAPRRG